MTEPAAENFSYKIRRDATGAWAFVKRSLQKRWVRWLAILAGFALLGWAIIWLLFARDLPSVDKLKTYEPPLPTSVRAIDGTPVHSYARERRVQLSFDEYPKLLVDAYLAAEDKTFFSHGGIDYPGLAGAVFDYVSKLGSGERAKGGSTITQQVAKNLLLGNEYSVSRKLKEAILARRIESALTKPQIMELYLNQIPLGRNSFGVQAAARAYFDKDVGDLQLNEMAFLAILPKAPETYGRARNVEKALARRNFVLGEMKRNGFIDDAQMQQAQAQPLGLKPNLGARYERVGDYFMEEVRRSLIGQYGESSDGGRKPYSVYDGGLWVRTSFDPKLQDYAEDALREGLMRYDRGKGWSGAIAKIDAGDRWQTNLAVKNIGINYDDWRAAVILSKDGGSATIGFVDGSTGTLPAGLAAMPKRGGGTAFSGMAPGDIIIVKQEGSAWALRNVPEVSGGMVVEDPHSGRILAMQGGFDASLQSYNRATQAERQPGSTFKPIAYSAALDNGMTPASIIVDGPFCVYQGGRLGQKCFRNFGGSAGAGPQTMRWGIEQSRNLMTVRAASQTGMDKVVETAARMGVSAPGKKYPAVLAIALGAGDTTVMRLTNAYSMLANNGKRLTPSLIDFVQDRRGKVIFRADTRPCDRCNAKDWDGKAMPRPALRTKQALDPMTAYQMVHIMEGVILRGTAPALQALKRPIFGKTGTTSGPTNVWFVGGSQDLVAGVYMGYDHPRPMGGYAQGGTLAAPIFLSFAKKAMADMPVMPFKAPAGIRMVRIDRKSGRKVFGAWPSDEPKAAVIWEAFKPESEPRRSIRKDEIAKPKKTEKTAGPAATSAGDSDFLQKQDGIY